MIRASGALYNRARMVTVIKSIVVIVPSLIRKEDQFIDALSSRQNTT